MRYVTNALSLNMLQGSGEGMTLRVTALDLSAVQGVLVSEDWTSCVGHADTAAVLSELVGKAIAFNRVSLSASTGDELLVAQYTGPRLPEGATSLPSGATITWRLVSLAAE